MPSVAPATGRRPCQPKRKAMAIGPLEDSPSVIRSRAKLRKRGIPKRGKSTHDLGSIGDLKTPALSENSWLGL